MAISKITFAVLLVVVAPVAVAVLLYQLTEFDPVPLPEHGLSRPPVVPANQYAGVLESSVHVGEGKLPGPEDLAYDAETGFLYTGCSDGWIKRLHIAHSSADEKEKEKEKAQVEVENWAFTGGRPLGLAFGPDKQLIVADAYKGLLRVSREGTGAIDAKVEVLTEEAEGLKFRLTDGVDVGRDGVIYFTDASYKSSLEDYMADMLEGRPYGRLMSFDPSINKTQVLVRDLYFANGVAISPSQDFLVFCETFLRRCRKYYIKSERKGSVENFVDDLPGLPDNIRYDGEGRYWIALPTGKNVFSDALMRYPVVRKAVWMVERVLRIPLPHKQVQSNGGVMAVDLKGEAIALFSEPGLSMFTVGLKIRNQLYLGSLANTYINRLRLTHHHQL